VQKAKNQVDVVGALILFEENEFRFTRRAKSIFRKYASRKGVEFDDLKQELLMTAWKFALLYKPSHGVPFPQYIERRMTWSALRYLYADNRRFKFPMKQVQLEDVRGTSEDGDPITRGSILENRIGSEEIADWHAADRYYSRLYDVLQFIATSPEITESERCILQLHYIDGLKTAAISHCMRQHQNSINRCLINGVRKIAAHFGIVKLIASPELFRYHATHQRWHLARGRVNPTCPLCKPDTAVS
jgi:DNA-directed RNA polymerase specialized sigma24 family protein